MATLAALTEPAALAGWAFLLCGTAGVAWTVADLLGLTFRAGGR